MDNFNVSCGSLIMLLAILCIALSQTRAQHLFKGTEHHGEYCTTETFRAECAVGEVILVRKALYGRMEIGRCVELNLGYIGCHEDVIRIVDARCSGKRTCEIRVPDTELEQLHVCIRDLKSYLSVSYMCLKVEEVSNDHCEFNTEVNITRQHGFISSTTMYDTPSCGGSTHPWIILAKPGQRVNLTLYDFSADLTYGALDKEGVKAGGGESTEVEVCHEYGFVEDPEGGQTQPICGGTRRVSQVYISHGHLVKVWLTSSRDLKYFIIEYTVTGCADIPDTDLVWFNRPPLGGNRAEMGCLFSNTRWHMICEKHTWVGKMANCTQPVPEVHDVPQRQNFPVTYGIAIAIIIGAVLGVAFIICIVGLVRYRRRPRNRRGGPLNGRETVLLQSRVESPYETKAQMTPVDVAKDNRNHDDKTILPDYKMTNAAETPCTLTCRHQRHPVKVNGSEYEHIWEAPLPGHPMGTVPEKTTDVRCTITTLPRANVANAHAAALAFSTFKTPDVIHGTGTDPVLDQERPLYVSSKDILRSPINRKVIDSDGGKYSSLKKPQRHEFIPNTNCISADV